MIAIATPNQDDKSYIPVTLYKNSGNIGGKILPENCDSTRLQGLPPKNNKYFDIIHHDFHFDTTLIDYTIGRKFPEMSLSEMDTLLHICELEETQILQSLALAVLKIPNAGNLVSSNCFNFMDFDGNILWYYTCTK